MGSLTSGSFAIVTSSLFVIAFLWVSLALGRRSGLVPRDGSLLERGIVAIVIGAGCLQFLPLLLGAFGILYPATLRIATGIVVLALSFDLFAVARRAREALRELASSDGWLRAWVLALAPGLLVIFLVAVSPTLDADGLSYHLMVPKRWLTSGTLAYLPTYLPSNSPMGFEMLFAIALVFAGDAAAKTLHFAFGVLCAGGLCLAGVRLNAKVAGVIAATLFLLGPTGAQHLLGAAYVEGATACALSAATLSWLIWFRERNFGWLRCAGVLAGIAVSFKLTAALFPVAMGALTLFLLWDEGRSARSVVRPGAGQLLALVPLLVVPLAPWFVRSAMVTGNPIFPLFSRIIPSRDFPATLAARYDTFNRYLNWASSVGPRWSIERRQLILHGFVLALLLVGAVLFARVRSRLSRAAVVTFVLTAVVQVLTAGLYVRYWIPLLAVLTLAFAAVFEGLFTGPRARMAVVVGTLGLSAFGAFKTLQTVDGDFTGILQTSVASTIRSDFLDKHIPIAPLFHYANASLPEESRVLLAGTCIGGFYVDRWTYCAEFPSGSIRFATPEFVSDLRSLGVTHVIAPRALASGGPMPPLDFSSAAIINRVEEYDALSRLLRARGRLLYTASDQGIYAVDVSSPLP